MEQPTKLEELQDLLEENIELARENNKLLKRMHRMALIGGTVKALIWIGVLVASGYFTLVYLEPLLTQFQGIQGHQYQALFDLYNGQFGQ